MSPNGILLLDNSERVMDGKYSSYLSMLDGFQFIHFQQPYVPTSGPGLGNYVDRSGNQVKHRWVTTVAWKNPKIMLTTSGDYFVSLF
jgi:hypothetical protein